MIQYIPTKSITGITIPILLRRKLDSERLGKLQEHTQLLGNRAPSLSFLIPNPGMCRMGISVISEHLWKNKVLTDRKFTSNANMEDGWNVTFFP